MSSLSPGRTVHELFTAIGSRDLRRIHAHLASEIVWQNVPHPPVTGRDEVLAMLAGIVTWSDEVHWDVVSVAVDGSDVHVEHTDHFVVDGVDHAVRCNGVVTVDEGVVMAVRDFVDLGEWRTRIGPVLTAMAERPADLVVERHLTAVRSGDPVAMAADYTLDAILERPDGVRKGWREIADYFDSVPSRLAGGSVEFDPPRRRPDGRVEVEWTIRGAERLPIGGHDEYQVVAGRIRHQVVTLTDDDF